MNTIPKITLDNNCVINLLDYKAQSPTSVDALKSLFQMALSNKVDIAITTRVEADLSNDKNEDRRLAMVKTLELFPIIGTVGRVGLSRIGSGDFIVDYKVINLSDELQKIIFPGGLDKSSATYINKVNDLDHIIGHMTHGRDIFVTDDKGILRKQNQLKESPGVLVMSPESCLKFIDEFYQKKSTEPNLRSDFMVAKLELLDKYNNYKSPYNLEEGKNEFHCRANYSDGYIEEEFPAYWTCLEEGNFSSPWHAFGTHKLKKVTLHRAKNHVKYLEIGAWLFPPEREKDIPGNKVSAIGFEYI